MSPEILLFIIKLSIGGIAAFLAIFIMSKTRDASWMFLVAGFIFAYAVIVYDLMRYIGVIPVCPITVPKINLKLDDLISTTVPELLFIISFIIKLAKK